MSLADSPDGMFRPEDKAFKMLFGASTDEGNSFEEFFNEDMYKLDGNDEENKEQAHHSEDFFGNGGFNGDQYKLPSLTLRSNEQNSPTQPWREGVWCLRQRGQHSALMVEKTRRSETKRPSPMQTMDVVNQYTQRAPAPASLDVNFLGRTKRYATSPHAGSIDSPSYSHPPFHREATLSPSPMYCQLPTSLKAGHGETSTWQQDFQNFHICLPYEPRLQSPSLHSPSTIRMQDQQAVSTRQMNSARMAENHGVALSPRLQALREGYYSGAIDPFVFETQELQQSPSHYEPLSPRHPRANTHGPLSMHSPSSGSVPSSGSSHHSYEARSQTSNTSVDMHSQPVYSPPTILSHPPLPTLEPEETYPVLAAPNPQRIPHPILQQPIHAPLAGLGIRYPELDQMSQAVLYEPQTYTMQDSATVGMALPYPPPARPAPGALSSYPPLPPPPSYVFSDHSPFTTPRKQRRSPSRSPSPPISPTNISPRRNPRRSPTRTVTDYTHSRRKSIHKSGPIKDNTTQEPLPTPRARSSSRPPRTPKGPKTPTGGGQLVDFVNFTPADSAKLMNDVAPSGSSKTRARRELEAREKRKKLSEAALKAVKVAGGDVAVFEKAIFA
ncbi:hypothetical protein PV05_05080 [Exophiala xenobiotica]|uniref:Developmental regulatory protein wetA n=1 Tax=Exophiala xenobiotica TaxID=348802 RepID=A0A0D2ENT7_9EURO|nr:uncharacterized protein PV05_05080 [Exophiala xenobiotica]KIW56415.1 hypothetical protein PV05_05080 [Exophiala xenobiotica]